MRASEEHREAQRRWNVIAGNVDVDWAISNRGDISSAVQLRNDVIAGTGARGSGNDERDQVANLAHTIVSRLAVLRKFGVGSESFPALLDEPFSGLDSQVSPALLELLVRSSAHQQIIVFTNNDAICEWARVERMTGAVSLIEPTANTPIVTPELDAPQVIQL
jgi:ABC-type nitrate/sulfonate/bicarbonate transport system ATPase subunit